MKEWWLYKKQTSPDTDVPVGIIIILYIVFIGMGLLFRTLTWPEKEHVTAIFLCLPLFCPPALFPFSFL